MKRVLIISYYWPPAGGISVLRSLKITKYLRQFGWEPVVYTAENADYPYLDNGGFKDIPEGIEIITHPIMEPFKVFKFLTGRKKEDALNSIVQVRTKEKNFLDTFGIWLRGNFFIPDARSLWIKPSVKKLKNYLKENPVDAIFSDGPPHTNTRIAYFLAKKLNIPWLADFQDPWTQADYYKMMLITPLAHKIHSNMEQAVFTQANKITIASPTWKKDLESIGANNVDVIYYGYDEDDFKNLTKKKDKNNFDIAHIGLLGIDRHPEYLMECLGNIDTNKKIRIHLAGQVDQQVKADLQNTDKIEVIYYGMIDRNKALQLGMNSDLLLLPLNKAENAKGRLPGKIYEYLRMKNLILALGDSDGDASHIIKECNLGECIEYDDKNGLQKFLKEIITNPVEINPNDEKIQSFSNENQTKKIANYLDEII